MWSKVWKTLHWRLRRQDELKWENGSLYGWKDSDVINHKK